MGCRISGVILAGGASRRFGGITKSNIVIGGERIISRIINSINGIFDEVIIVTNNPSEFREFTACRIIGDQYLKAGPLGGIHAALKASSCDAVFIVAGDMPFLNNNLIISQSDYFQSNPCDVLIPSLNQNIEPLHAIYNITILNKLEEYLSGDSNYAVRQFFNKVDTRYLEFENTGEAKIAFTNINTPTDFINFRSLKNLNI